MNSRVTFLLHRAVELSNPARSFPGWSLFVCKCFPAWALFAFQKFQRCAATGRDMRDLVGYFGGVRGRDAIAAAHNRNRTRIFCDRMRHLERATRETGHLKHSHRSIPDDGAGAGYFL